MAFSDQIKSLTGIDTSNSTIDGYLDQWMTDGVKEIVNVLPPDLLEECLESSTLTNSPSTFPLSSPTTGKIISVSREDADTGTRKICRRVSAAASHLLQDTDSLMYSASVTDPAYYIKSKTLHVFPTPTATQEAEVIYVYLRAVDASADSTILNFPSEAEYLVVNYASIKSLSYLMNQISQNELDLVTDFADANNWLNTEEDSELVSSRIQIIGAQINDFNAKRNDKEKIYKWYKDQYSLLKQDYAIGLKMLTQGTMNPNQEGASA